MQRISPAEIILVPNEFLWNYNKIRRLFSGNSENQRGKPCSVAYDAKYRLSLVKVTACISNLLLTLTQIEYQHSHCHKSNN